MKYTLYPPVLVNFVNKQRTTILPINSIIYYKPLTKMVCYVTSDGIEKQEFVQQYIDLQQLYKDGFYELNSGVFINTNFIRSVKNTEFGCILKTRSNKLVNLY